MAMPQVFQGNLLSEVRFLFKPLIGIQAQRGKDLIQGFPILRAASCSTDAVRT